MGVNWETGVSDPFKGFNQGMASLGQALQQKQQMQRQASNDARQNTLADIQMQKAQMDLRKGQREEDNMTGLQSLMQSQPSRQIPTTATVPNPQFTSPDPGTMEDPNPNFQQPPTIQQQGQRPMNDMEKSQEVQDYLKSRSMFDQLKEMGQAEDLTSKVSERSYLMMQRVHGAAAMAGIRAESQGADKDAIKAASKHAAIDTSKQLGIYTPQIEQADFSAGGLIAELPSQAGGVNTIHFDPVSGKITVTHVAAAKPEKESETWGEPYAAQVGGKKVMLQKSSTGQIKPVVQDTSTTVRVSTGGGHTEFKDVMALRKEFSSLPEVKDYPMIQSQGLRAKKALEESLKNRSNMPVDQTVITTFNKLLDPSSVVRESEYARTPQDMALLSRIKGKWDKVQLGGAGLDLNERQALVRMIDNFSTIADAQYKDQVDQYTEIAKRNNFNPSDVIRLGYKAPPPTGGKGNSGKPVPKRGIIRYNSSGQRI